MYVRISVLNKYDYSLTNLSKLETQLILHPHLKLNGNFNGNSRQHEHINWHITECQ